QAGDVLLFGQELVFAARVAHRLTVSAKPSGSTGFACRTQVFVADLRPPAVITSRQIALHAVFFTRWGHQAVSRVRGARRLWLGRFRTGQRAGRSRSKHEETTSGERGSGREAGRTALRPARDPHAVRARRRGGRFGRGG